MLPLLRESIACQNDELPLDERKRCRISNSALARACSPRAGGGPDFLVLPYPQAQTAAGNWAVRDPGTSKLLTTFRIYRCREITPGVSVHVP